MNYNNIYKEYHLKILGFFKYKINSPEDAEELANNVMIKVYKNLHLYDEEKSTLKNWIFAISKNVLIDYFRKSKVKKLSLENQFEDVFSMKDLLASNDIDPFQRCVEKEKRIKIETAMSNIKCDRMRQISLLFFIEDKSLKEISNIIKKPIGTVKASIFRSRKLLQEKLILKKI